MGKEDQVAGIVEIVLEKVRKEIMLDRIAEEVLRDVDPSEGDLKIPRQISSVASDLKRTQERVCQNYVAFLALVSTLQNSGNLHDKEFSDLKRQTTKDLLSGDLEGLGVSLSDRDGKDEAAEVREIDCESRKHVCRAYCCMLGFPLSKTEVEKGIVEWDEEQPFVIRKGQDGYCWHLDPDQLICTIYENRPVACRRYICEKDSRVWKSFPEQILSDRLARLFKLTTETEVSTSSEVS